MSAQPAEVVPIQGELFQIRMKHPKGGALSLSHTRKIGLPAEQVAELLKRQNLGCPADSDEEGDVVSLVGGSGRLRSVRYENGDYLWTVEVEDLQVEL